MTQEVAATTARILLQNLRYIGLAAIIASVLTLITLVIGDYSDAGTVGPSQSLGTRLGQLAGRGGCTCACEVQGRLAPDPSPAPETRHTPPTADGSPRGSPLGRSGLDTPAGRAAAEEQPWRARGGCARRVPEGTEHLPEGVVVAQSDLHWRRLRGDPAEDLPADPPQGLLAIVAGIEQKESVDKIVRKFPLANFTVILFHYDGIVDKWNDLPWSQRVTHISARGQGKWWYAKRFLHPDVVAPYKWILVWDEDLGVEEFDAFKYLELAEAAGLEISQPALHENSTAVHHRFTVRSPGSTVHKTFHRRKGKWPCNETTLAPPCAGWVEVMAPVFTNRAWRCFWHLIQNDLVHGWGLDFRSGYCTRGHRVDAIGIVDGAFVTHKDLHTLSARHEETGSRETFKEEVRNRSYEERLIFRHRWNHAVWNDMCWIDRYLGDYNNHVVDPPPPSTKP